MRGGAAGDIRGGAADEVGRLGVDAGLAEQTPTRPRRELNDA